MKKYQGIINAVPFIISIALFTARMLSTDYIDANGILHEPFYLIPLAYLFLFVGIVMLVWNVVTNIRENNR